MSEQKNQKSDDPDDGNADDNDGDDKKWSAIWNSGYAGLSESEWRAIGENSE